MELNKLMFNCCEEKGGRGKGKGRGRWRMILYQEKSMRWRHESFVPSIGISVQMPFVSQVQYLVVLSMTLGFRVMYFLCCAAPECKYTASSDTQPKPRRFFSTLDGLRVEQENFDYT